MHIEKLKIEKLYGYIDKEITFNSDLTILVGINGSGKTSILNIVNWILSPSLPNLCVTEFKSLTLSFTFKSIRYEVTCKHNKMTFNYKISCENVTYNPLVVRIIKNPSEIKNDALLRATLIQSYSGLTPDEKEKNTWEVISKFPNPTVIGLDRNLYTEESPEHIYIEEGLKGRIVRKHQGQSISPLVARFSSDI